MNTRTPKDTAIVQEIWRKAYNENGFTLRAQSATQLEALRQRLYGAVRGVKDNPGKHDKVLVAAVEGLIVKKDSKALTLTLLPRLDDPLMQVLMEQSGITAPPGELPPMDEDGSGFLERFGGLVIDANADKS